MNNNQENGFEVINNPMVSETVDEVAEKIFLEGTKILGGLKNLIQYRHLTWLPSLAEASYVMALRNEYMKTAPEIARELGITEQTVRNILNSDENEVEKLLAGEIEETDEHIAGGLAKLAYKRIKGLKNSEEKKE